MAPILLAALLLDALFGLWRPGWLAESRPDLVQRRIRAALQEDVLPALDRRVLGGMILSLGIGVALLLGWVVQALPLSWVFAVALTAIVLGMKRLSRQANGIADTLRSAPDGAVSAYQRFSGGEAPAEDGIVRSVYAALPARMARDVLTPALALLIFGLPGLLVSAIIRFLRDPSETGSKGAGWSATRLDTLINWPANWVICALLGRIAPDVLDGDLPIHIEARVEALWKLWLCLLVLVAILTLL